MLDAKNVAKHSEANGNSKGKGSGWSASRRPGKPGKVGAQFPSEGSKFMGSKPKGKLPMGGGSKAKKG